MSAPHRSGPTTRIAGVEAFVIVGDKDYVGGAGLRPPADASPKQRRALAEIGDRQICVYPPQAQSCLVKITTDDGTVGWGEGHAPLGPRATVAVVQDVLVDAHGAYASHTALPVGHELQRLGVRWLEDPLPPEDVEGYVALAAALEMPVAAGETECTRRQFEERLRQKAVDLILPDICRAGGITEGRKIATVADLHNVRWAAHVSMGTSVHVAAAAHLAAASANFLIFELSSTPNPIGDDLLTRPLRPDGGILRVPDGPGLGIQFDEAKLRQHLM